MTPFPDEVVFTGSKDEDEHLLGSTLQSPSQMDSRGVKPQDKTATLAQLWLGASTACHLPCRILISAGLSVIITPALSTPELLG